MSSRQSPARMKAQPSVAGWEATAVGLKPYRRDRPSAVRTGLGHRISTPRMLAIWRTVSLLICVVVAVLTGIGLNSTEPDLSTGQEVLRLTSMHADVAAAEATMLAGRELPLAEHLSAGQEELAQAASTVAEVARTAQPTQIAEVNAALVDYAGDLRIAAKLPDSPTAEVEESRALLNSTLDTMIASDTTILEQATTPKTWVIVLLMVPVATLLVASVVVARRTRRVVTVGLLIGLVLAGGAAYQGYSMASVATYNLSGATSTSYAEALQWAEAIKAARQAELIDLKILDGQVSATSMESTYAELLGIIGRPESVTTQDIPKEALSTIAEAHNDLRVGDTGLNLAQATAAYDTLDDWLTGQLAAATQSYVDASQSAIRRAAVYRWLVVGLIIAAGMSSAVGINGHLRRYR